ncbi:MAG: universal stress protein [Nitriliruptoraceae bacterium]
MPRTVVIPLDGSTTSRSALPLGHLLAARFHAVVQTVAVEHGGTLPEVDVVLRGEPIPALLDHLATLDGALVAMASHGHGGIRRHLVGSVTEGILRRSPAPVVVIGPAAEAPDRRLARSLLAGISAGPRLDRLMATVATWAPQLRASVTLTHVRRPTSTELYVSRTTGRPPPGHPELGSLAADLTARGIEASARPVTRDDPVAALLALAEQLPPPVLLAVDTHRGDRSAYHDVAYRLIRDARWPVLATVGS